MWFLEAKNIICTNYLTLTLSKPLFLGKNEEVISDVNGLGKFYRWTGEENLCRKEIMTPNIIVACNKLMSGNDQIAQAMSFIHKEQRIDFKLLMFIIDLCIHQAAVRDKIKKSLMKN